MRTRIQDNFWAHVDVRGPDECWPWLLGEERGGYRYGGLAVDGRWQKAHRYAFYLAHGYWPKVTLHTCDNPPCCNPAHLIDGTQKTNAQDMARKRRHGNARVTVRGVEVIRQMMAAGHTYRSVGEYLGLSYHSVYSVLRER